MGDWGLSFSLSTPATVRALELLFALSVSIQTLEYWQMRVAMQGQGLWVWSIQRNDIPTAWIRKILDVLFTSQNYSILLLLRFIALIHLALQGSNLINVGFLFVSNLAVLIRWRGAFNGGSDFMTLVVLTGLFIAQVVTQFGDTELAWRACFWYITIQAITSYFLSGAVKLLRPEWRNGNAMTIFLNAAIHGPLRQGHWLRKPMIAALGSWTFIVWECLAPVALLDERMTLAFCLTAVIFHFLVFWFFGLNRFFWAWLTTFPAILWCAGQI